MRATISFETDLEQVEGTMAVLASSEEYNFRAAADILSNYTVLDGNLLDTITEVLRLVDMSAVQLRQYRDMLVGFERARFETMLPQPAPDATSLPSIANGNDMAALQRFNKFVASMAEQEEVPDEQGDTNESPEG